MAQKAIVQLTDDLDGTDLDNGQGETVAFSLDGTSYEMDLSHENAAELRNRLSTFIVHGRKVSNGHRTGRRTSAASSSASAAEIRAWARDSGHEVPERGRIPADVREAFESAN